MENLPYAQRAGTLESMLKIIRTASVPAKFSPDFVSTRLSMKGGSARSTIPFIKKMGFVTSEGVPTKRYTEFRNNDKSGRAVAASMKEIYATLFDMNEYVYELDNQKLKALIVEATGAEEASTTVFKTLATFVTLNTIADFDDTPDTSFEQSTIEIEQNNIPMQPSDFDDNSKQSEGINLSYTINLNLPPSTDIEVFNAIFKSLKQHLLKG